MRNKILMTLALLLTAVTGAWAQSSLDVVELEVPADWENNTSNVTAGDLPGFNASTLAEVQAWTGAPAMAMVIYAFNGDVASYVSIINGKADNGTNHTISKAGIFNSKSAFKIYYTGKLEITEWELKPDDTGKTWTLAKMPASNIELQVEYFAESNLFLSKDALADKANITVTAGETTVEFGDDGKSTNTVTEGNTVTTKFTGKKVLGMKVEKKAVAPSLNITSPVVGQVIGSDGKNYNVADVPTGVEKVAMICYVSGSHGLALALTDEGAMSWSTAIEKCAAHTPAFTGGTWKLATKDEWNSMITAAGSYSALRDGFSSVGGTNMQSDVYRSSTEDGSDKAWYYVFIDGYGDWYADSKDDALYVRACLAF